MRRGAFAFALVFFIAAAGESAKSRTTLTAPARQALERADAFYGKGDKIAALDAYMQAVTADPMAADVDAIERYSYPFYSETDLAEKKRAAYRQYLRLYPSDWHAAKKFLLIAEPAEAERVVQAFIESQPGDPEVYRARAFVRTHANRYLEALEDYEKAAELEPKNAAHHARAGFAAWEAVSKDTKLSADDKRKVIRRGLRQLDQAEALDANAFALGSSRNFLVREQAKLATPEEKAKATAGWQDVKSTWGTYQYRLPAGWKKVNLNSYQGSGGELLEQIYPAASITPEYCWSFRTFNHEGVRQIVVENHVYDNGHVRGCLAVHDRIKVATNEGSRHTSFRFPTSRGIEDITIIAPRDGKSAETVAAIVDSVRTK